MSDRLGGPAPGNTGTEKLPTVRTDVRRRDRRKFADAAQGKRRIFNGLHRGGTWWWCVTHPAVPVWQRKDLFSRGFCEIPESMAKSTPSPCRRAVTQTMFAETVDAGSYLWIGSHYLS